MGRRLFALALAAAAASSPAAAGARCEPPAPTVEVELAAAKVVYDHSKSLAEIRRAAAGQILADHGGLPVAVTIGNLRSRARSAIELQTGDHDPCGYIKHVTLSLGYDDHRVLLPKEVDVRSCAYKVIKAHEERHVAIDKKVLREFVPVVERELAREAAAVGAVQDRFESRIPEALTTRLKAAIERALQPLYRARIERHRALDTRREYERIARACTGELRRLIREGRSE